MPKKFVDQTYKLRSDFWVMAQTREDQQKVKISFFFIFVHRVVKFSGCSPYSYWLFENIYTIKSIQFLFYLGSDYWMGGANWVIHFWKRSFRSVSLSILYNLLKSFLLHFCIETYLKVWGDFRWDLRSIRGIDYLVSFLCCATVALIW